MGQARQPPSFEVRAIRARLTHHGGVSALGLGHSRRATRRALAERAAELPGAILTAVALVHAGLAMPGPSGHTLPRLRLLVPKAPRTLLGASLASFTACPRSQGNTLAAGDQALGVGHTDGLGFFAASAAGADLLGGQSVATGRIPGGAAPSLGRAFCDEHIVVDAAEAAALVAGAVARFVAAKDSGAIAGVACRHAIRLRHLVAAGRPRRTGLQPTGDPRSRRSGRLLRKASLHRRPPAERGGRGGGSDCADARHDGRGRLGGGGDHARRDRHGSGFGRPTREQTESTERDATRRREPCHLEPHSNEAISSSVFRLRLGTVASGWG
jgi:hypothetical protein